MVLDFVIGLLGFVTGCALTAVFFGDIKAEIAKLRADVYAMTAPKTK